MPRSKCHSSILRSTSSTAGVIPVTEAGTGTEVSITRRADDDCRDGLVSMAVCQPSQRASSVRNHLIVELPAHALIGPEDDGADFRAACRCLENMRGDALQCYLQSHFDGPVVFGNRMRGSLVLADVDPGKRLHGLDHRLEFFGYRDGSLQRFGGLHAIASDASFTSASRSASFSLLPASIAETNCGSSFASLSPTSEDAAAT